MAKESDMNEMLKMEEGSDPYMGDQSGQPFVFLLRVTQFNGKPLPIGGFTVGHCHKYYMKLLGWFPKEVVIMNDQEVIMELDEEMSLMGDIWVVPLGRQSISVDSLVAKKDSVTGIVKE